MGGLNWEKATKNAKADKRATGLDLLRNPADEMSEITRLQQARQKKNRPTRGRFRKRNLKYVKALVAVVAL